MLLDIHVWHLGYRITVKYHCTGENRTIESGTFDYPQRVSISVGAACDPGQCLVDASGGSSEIFGTDYRSSAGGDNCIDMFGA